MFSVLVVVASLRMLCVKPRFRCQDRQRKDTTGSHHPSNQLNSGIHWVHCSPPFISTL